MSRRLLPAASLILVGALAAPNLAVAETTAPPSSQPSPSGSSSSGSQPQKPTPPGVEKTVALKLKDNKVEGMPAANSLLTANEISSVVPNTESVTPTADGVQVKLKSDPSGSTSQLMVKIASTGPTKNVQATWAAEKAKAQIRSTKNAGLYTFYANNKYGVNESFTDGTITHVLVTRGDASVIVWFAGIGFTGLKNDYAASRTEYRNVTSPKLIELLGKKFVAAPKPKESTQPQPQAQPGTTDQA